MSRRRALVAISAAQLAAGVAGQLIAVRERRSFDIALLRWRGKPENVVKDSWLLGTGLSAPVSMLTTQAVATVRLASAPSPVATRVLGVLGAAMTCGYLVEREFRSAFTPSGIDRRSRRSRLPGSPVGGDGEVRAAGHQPTLRTGAMALAPGR